MQTRSSLHPPPFLFRLLSLPNAGGDFEQDAGGVALALALGSALLRHLGSGAPWLAKDVVWLLPDASCGLVAAMGAWADAYAGQVRGCVYMRVHVCIY